MPRRLIDVSLYLPCVAVAFCLFWWRLEIPAIAIFVVARVAYVLFTGLSLKAQAPRLGVETPEQGEARYAAFHRQVLRFQNIDGCFTVTLAFATRGSWDLGVPGWVNWAGGVLLVLIGLGFKGWAARTLGTSSYTWHDFFVPKPNFVPVTTGPYRFLKDPMYTMGYLQVYGMALALLSWQGMAAAVFSQITILLMNQLVEKPHFNGLCSKAAAKAPELGAV